MLFSIEPLAFSIS